MVTPIIPAPEPPSPNSVAPQPANPTLVSPTAVTQQQGPPSVQDATAGTQPQNAPPTATAITPNQQPHPMSKIYDGLLRTMTGGPIFYTDAATGERKQAPQSRSTLSKSIVAAA